MNHKEFLDERWLVSSSAKNAAQLQHEDEDEDEDEEEEEALSLSDLPLIHQWRKENQNNDDNNISLVRDDEHDQEFDFCSFSKESEMCAADEIFFKGQILPLRHSVSSEKGLLRNYDGGSGGYQRRSFSRSDSMDHYYSSRSSSISSHQSSTSSGSGSGSSSATATATAAAAGRYKPKLPPRIQFHSHPSPSPRLHFPSNRHGATLNHRNSISKSSIWNVLRLGLVTPLPAEITFKDLKARSTNSGSRNSTSSNSSGASQKKKMRPRILGGGGCTCAADAVDTAAAPRVVIIKRSASESDGAVMHDRSSGGGEKLRKKQAAKKVLSQNRTFEWLKQLSVEGAADQ